MCGPNKNDKGSADGTLPTQAQSAPISILDNDIAAGSAIEHVNARAAKQDVIPRATREHARSFAADQDIVPVPVVGRQLDQWINPESRVKASKLPRRLPGVF
jgi:hypothetical protein